METRAAGGNTSSAKVLLRKIRRYLSSFGLLDRAVASAAAKRILATVRDEQANLEGPMLERQALSLARRWVENFSRLSHGPGTEWFFMIPALLQRFPFAFLASRLPGTRELERDSSLELLPEEAPCWMPAQAMDAAFAPLATRSTSQLRGRIPE